MYRSVLWNRIALGALALALMWGCSGSEPTPPAPDPVASVVLFNVPTTPLFAPNGVQLFATALSATGATINGVSLSWKTSDAGIATVSSSGFVTAVGAGVVTITVTGGGKSASATIDVRAGGTLGPAGGTLSVLDGAVIITVPAGALNTTVEFSVRPISDAAVTARIVPGSGFEIVTTPSRPIPLSTLELRFNPAILPAGANEGTLQLYSLVGNAWHVVPGSTVSTSRHSVSGGFQLGATFGAAITSVGSIALDDALRNDALYTGEARQLSTVVRDPEGYILTGRTIAWASSNPAIATVADGTVTATGAGSAIITASAEGKSDTVSVLVLAKPIADWTQATEWTMHQGNASHTGFVAATLDPTVFTKRWSRSLLGTAPLANPVTFGPGMVFGSSGDSFGTETAFAVDLGSGVIRWTVDFGQIHGVHPPAYANGTVYLTTSGHADSYLYALDAATGARRFRSSYANQWSRYYAPVIAGTTVVSAGGEGSGMYAFDASTGAQRWFVTANQDDQWTPAVRDGLAYAYTGSGSPMVQVVDVTRGTSLATIPDPNYRWSGYTMRSAPTLGGSNDLLATASGRLVSFDLQRRVLAWELSDEFTGTVAVADDVLYVINGGQFEARRESDGGLLWAWNPPAGLLRPTVIVTRNLVFASSQDTTYALDLSARRKIWQYPSGGDLALSAQGVLVIATPDGWLHAISVR